MCSRFPIMALLLAALLSGGGCSSKEEKIADFLARGDRLSKSGDPVRAVLEYKNALQLDIKNVRATVALAKAYLAQEDFPRAYGAFNAALALDPECDEARLELASLLTMAGEYETALDELGKIRNPEVYQVRWSLMGARALTGLGRHDEVIKVLEALDGIESNRDAQILRALCFNATGNTEGLRHAVSLWRVLDPRDPNSYLLLAKYFSAMNDGEEARSQLREMVERNPDDIACHILRARGLEEMGYMPEAQEAYEALPDCEDSLNARAGYWARRKDLPRAVALWENLVRRNPKNVSPVLNLASGYTDLGDFARADASLDDALKKDLKRSEREQVLLAKAVLHAKKGELENARHIFEAILKENQGNYDAHRLLGKLWFKLKDPGRAEIHLSQAVSARPNDEEAQVLLARSQLQMANDVTAGETLKRALQVNPASRAIRIELLRYLLARNEREQAMRVLDRGIESEPRDVFLINLRGELNTSARIWKSAESDFRKIIDLQPQDPLGYIGLGRLMFAQGKGGEALKFFGLTLDLENGMQISLPLLLHYYLSKNERPAAIALARTMVEKHPDSSLAFLSLGQAYLAVEDLARAEAAFEKAVQLAPHWLEPYRFISAICLKRGELDRAIECAEQIQRSRPSLVNLIQLTFFYEDASRPLDALKCYQSLVDQGLNSPEILNNLAFLYAEHPEDENSLKRASGLIAEALQQQPENSFFLDTAAWIAYKRGDFGAAWLSIQEAASRQQHPLHNLHAALILKARGDKALALKYADLALQGRLDKESQKRALALIKELSES